MAGGVVLAVLALWRLNQGPLPLEFLKDRVAEALTPAEAGVAASIGELELEWRGWSRTLEVRAKDLSYKDGEGKTVFRVPFADVSLSGPRLLVGEVAPLRIALDRPQLTLLRGERGVFELRGEPEGARDRAGPDLFEMLRHAGSAPGSGLDTLELVTLKDASVVVDDPGGRFGMVRAFGLDGQLARDQTGWRGSASVALVVEGEKIELSAEGNYFERSGKVDGSVQFKGLEPDLVLRHIPTQPATVRVDGKLTGSIAFAIEDFRSPVDLDLVATATAGRVVVDPFLPQPFKFDSLRFQVGYDANEDTLRLRTLALERGPVKALFSGQVKDLARPRVSLSGSIREVPVDDIDEYWPVGLGPIAREWVTGNLEKGFVRLATVDLAGHVGGAAGKDFVIESLGGRIEFDGVTTHYFRPLPAAVETRGHAVYTEKRFDILIDSARYGKLQVDKATVAMTDLHTDHNDFGDIAIDVSGPVSDVLRVVDAEPLRFARRLAVKPEAAAGTAKGRIAIHFPISPDIRLDSVKIEATADLANVSLPAAPMRLPLADGALKLSLDKKGMTLAGSGKVSGIPARLAVEEYFEPKDGLLRRMRVTAPLGRSQLDHLGVDLSRYLEGSIEADVRMETARGGQAKGSFVADLHGTELRLPQLAWSKPREAAGTLRAALNFEDGRLASLENVRLAAADLDVTGRIALASDGGAIRHVDIDRFRLGRTDFSGTVSAEADGYLAALQGPFADLRDLLDEFDDDGGAMPPFRLDARFAKAQVGELDPVDDMHVRLRHDGERVASAAVTGSLGEAPVEMTYAGAAAKSSFAIRSKNAGAVLKAYEGFDSISRGQLRIDGVRAGEGADRYWDVTMLVEDFDLVEAPILAQLLSAASLTGLLDVVRGRGVHFNRLDARLESSERRLAIKDLLAQGRSLGISASGVIDKRERTSEITGMLVPAYLVNQIIGSIPLIGTFITGGKGEGLLASEFKISGPLAKPQITVNPLTALTPGIMRNLFRFTDAPAKDPPLPVESGGAPTESAR